MPQLQVVNTGANPINTALGSISQGFIESFNQRSMQSKNDEVFSRIKSKYGPNVDADTLYKDVLQSRDLDQSYKENTLSKIKELGALQRDKEKTRHDQIIEDIRKEELGIRRKKAEEDPSTKPLTPYQNQIIQNRIRYLDTQEKKIAAALEKGQKDLPTQVSKFTKAYFSGDNKISPENKAEVDSYVLEGLQQGKPLNQAMEDALQAKSMKDQLIEQAQKKTPERPTAYLGSPSTKQVSDGLEVLYSYLKGAYDSGITKQKDLRSIAKGTLGHPTGWSTEEINGVLSRIYHKPQLQDQSKSKEHLTNILLGK